jgi:ferritin-like protein
MSSEGLHEPIELLSEGTKNLHRAIVSLIEELEAVDWYNQRAEACSDADLKAVLMHHRNEEIEHAMMNLEWIRRHEGVFDAHMTTYLFKSGDITQLEAAAKAAKGEGAAASGGVPAAAAAAGAAAGVLNVGSLRVR